jgi:4-hydroxybenzoate polyprenyltransferase
VNIVKKREAVGNLQLNKSNTYINDFCILLKNCRFHLIAPYINAFVVLFGFLSASQLIDFFSINAVLVFLFSVIHTGAIYSLNNVYDVESDGKQLDTAKDFGRWNLSVKSQIAYGKINERKAFYFSFILFFLSSIYFYLEGGVLPTFFAVTIYIWGFAYSAPPIKLKNRFLWDLILHGVFWGSFLFLLGFSIRNNDLLNAAVPCLTLLFLTSVLWQFHNHFEDYYADKEAGSLTFVVRFGLKKSFYVYVLILGIAIGYSIFVIPIVWGTVAFLGAMTLYLVSGFRTAKESAFKTIHLPRRHFYLANSLIFIWMVMSLYLR